MDHRQRARWSLRLLLLIVAVFLLWLTETCVGIVRESEAQQEQPADAIVVFGAAQYDGRPSPVFRARLDHAFDLFQHGCFGPSHASHTIIGRPAR